MVEYKADVVQSTTRIKCGEWVFEEDGELDFVIKNNPFDDEIDYCYVTNDLTCNGIDNWIKEAKQLLACLEKIKEHFDAS